MARHRRHKLAPPPLPKVTPETLGELVTVPEIVAATRLSVSTIRRAYRLGELKGFMPGGRQPGRAGRIGYRFRRQDVLAWLYGPSAAGVEAPKADAP